MIIAISGTPGTGKTTLAKELAQRLGYKYLNLGDLVRDNKIAEGYDKKRKCLIVDVQKLKSEVLPIGKNTIVDSHLSHLLPPESIDKCIITTCELGELSKRLNKRGYGKEKIRENLDCEIFEVCLQEARERGHNVFVVDTTQGYDIEKIIEL